jgi:hypothetical protein
MLFLFLLAVAFAYAIYVSRKKDSPQPLDPAHPKQYVDSGFELTMDLIKELSLLDWSEGRPLLTVTNQASIDRTTKNFWEGSRRFAESRGSEEISYHPELWGHIERGLVDCALREEASEETDPNNWTARISTYLKAWASGLNPWAMTAVAEILLNQGKTQFALRAINTATRFPKYFNAKPQNEIDMIRVGYITIRVCIPRYEWEGQKDISQPDFEKRLLEKTVALREKIAWAD